MDNSSQKITNKGTGGGGSNTNKNGLSYEDKTELQPGIDFIKKRQINKNTNEIVFLQNKNKSFLQTKQSGFFLCMKEYRDVKITKAHGCKNPDECYIDEEKKEAFIIEKKFQQGPGSICEKIQTPHFKKWQYKRTFPGWKIVYIYCLSDWFKKNCIAELEYLQEMNVPVFWGNSLTYKEDIIKFIINYK